ncbi:MULTISPECIES: XTP/dITP diphosphatase [unclassified Lactobacillus]|uniref:XTP/dITP diphosphatase n=1 Tax=unclassified Lactobacillus TaxID=2620435 RepID=UPI000EFC2DD2|nr:MULTISPECIES: XTP/dITP diphosphatase [unclassified Lactobacillus]RMC25535.1 XTP/dITP diphosphatase [Lactobacillus sp. ESL0247]RMC29439.1 XTP/dITP diphosphatase [Lactobacillus sp. ESL0246]RMC33168.1 XTP/dITP diphosphatase [Lactobacillus sp. ESL0245]RMC50987.1 XTP/dITP diphosphatase [Lactobacillus sp. ESL0228]
MKVLFATTNQGKAIELKKAFENANINIKIITNADLINPPFVDEYGTTFEQNAKLKAHALANFSHLITIADDSGLMVDELDGGPGVHSARYAGEEHNDHKNNAKLLAELGGVPLSKRTAKFNTTIVVSMPNAFEQDLVVSGQCSGRILTMPRGKDGFGYDPLFYVDEMDKTFAEMSVDEKNSLSHRGKALQKLLKLFPSWLAQFNTK